MPLVVVVVSQVDSYETDASVALVHFCFLNDFGYALPLARTIQKQQQRQQQSDLCLWRLWLFFKKEEHRISSRSEEKKMSDCWDCCCFSVWTCRHVLFIWSSIGDCAASWFIPNNRPHWSFIRLCASAVFCCAIVGTVLLSRVCCCCCLNYKEQTSVFSYLVRLNSFWNAAAAARWTARGWEKLILKASISSTANQVKWSLLLLRLYKRSRSSLVLSSS